MSSDVRPSPTFGCNALSRMVCGAALAVLLAGGCSSNPPKKTSSDADKDGEGPVAAGAVVGGAAGAAVGAVGGAVVGGLGAIGACAPAGVLAVFCAPVGMVIGAVGGGVVVGAAGAKAGANAVRRSQQSANQAPEPIERQAEYEPDYALTEWPVMAAAQASEEVEPVPRPNATSQSLAMSAAQIGRNADHTAWAEPMEAAAPSSSEQASPAPSIASSSVAATTSTSAEDAVESEAPAVPEPVTLALRREAAAESPETGAAGLPAAGTSWSYEITDRIYGRNSTSLTVKVMRADDRTVEELVSTKSWGTRAAEAQRAIDTHGTSFIEQRIGTSAVLVEFAPYFLVANGEPAAARVADTAGYPTAGDSSWTVESMPPVWEQVTVAAGTYRALRVEITGRRRVHSWWLVPYKFSIRIWYAPQVKRYVRLEREEWGHSKQYSDVVVELVKFSPASQAIPERQGRLSVPRPGSSGHR